MWASFLWPHLRSGGDCNGGCSIAGGKGLCRSCERSFGPFQALGALVVAIVALFASQPPLKIQDLVALLTMVGGIFAFFVIMFLRALFNSAWAHLSCEDNVT